MFRIVKAVSILIFAILMGWNIYLAITESSIIPVFFASALLGCLLLVIIDCIKEKE